MRTKHENITKRERKTPLFYQFQWINKKIITFFVQNGKTWNPKEIEKEIKEKKIFEINSCKVSIARWWTAKVRSLHDFMMIMIILIEYNSSFCIFLLKKKTGSAQLFSYNTQQHSCICEMTTARDHNMYKWMFCFKSEMMHSFYMYVRNEHMVVIWRSFYCFILSLDGVMRFLSFC